MRGLAPCRAGGAPHVAAPLRRRRAAAPAAALRCASPAAKLPAAPLRRLVAPAAPLSRRRRGSAPCAADGDGAPSSPPPAPDTPPDPPKPGEDGDGDEALEAMRAMESEVQSYMTQMTLQRFLVLLVSTGGVKGTLAVFGAWLFHLDAFGGFHVSLPDAALALAVVSPVIVLDAVLMLPEWRATWEAPGPGEPRTPPPEVRVLSSAADGGGVPLDALEGADPDAVARVSPAIVARAPPRGLLASAQDAAALFQRKKVADNPAEGMAVWQEAVLILVGHLSEEMAQRAVLLGVLTAWLRDRGLEADFDPVRIDTYAPWVALGATLVFGAGMQKDALTRSLEVRAAVLNRDKRTGKTKVTQINNASLDAEISTGVVPPGVSPAATAAAATAVARLQAQVRAARERAQSVAQLDAVRNLADEAALGAAFIMTHNLFASFAAACVSDALFSGYQRLGAYRLRKQQQERWMKASSVLRAKALAVARRRKAARAAAAAAAAAKKEDAESESSDEDDDEDSPVFALDLQDDASFGEVTEEELAEAEAEEAAEAAKQRAKEPHNKG